MDASQLTTKSLTFEQVDILSSLKTTNSESQTNPDLEPATARDSSTSEFQQQQQQTQTPQIQPQPQPQSEVIKTEELNPFTSSIASLKPIETTMQNPLKDVSSMDFQTLQQLISGLQNASLSGDTKIRSIDMGNSPMKYSLDQQTHSPFVIPNPNFIPQDQRMQNINLPQQHQSQQQAYSLQPQQQQQLQTNSYVSPEQLALSQTPLPPPERLTPYLSPPVDRLEANEELMRRQKELNNQRENFETMMANQTNITKRKDFWNSLFDEIQLPFFVAILFFLFQLPFFKANLFKFFPFLFYDSSLFTLQGYVVSSVIFASVYYFFYRVWNYVLFQK